MQVKVRVRDRANVEHDLKFTMDESGLALVVDEPRDTPEDQKWAEFPVLYITNWEALANLLLYSGEIFRYSQQHY